MKIKEDLMLRNICDEWVVVPMGARLQEFNGIMKLNESGAFIWKLLQQENKKEDIIRELLNEYDIDEKEATREVDDFIDMLSKKNVLEGI